MPIGSLPPTQSVVLVSLRHWTLAELNLRSRHSLWQREHKFAHSCTCPCVQTVNVSLTVCRFVMCKVKYLTWISRARPLPSWKHTLTFYMFWWNHGRRDSGRHTKCDHWLMRSSNNEMIRLSHQQQADMEIETCFNFFCSMILFYVGGILCLLFIDVYVCGKFM